MTRTKEYLEARLDKLQQKDPIANRGIIRKLERQLRMLENKERA